MENKNLYIIAGCNGAGKTTASFTILPDILNCYKFVNADEIARGLSPFQPDKVDFEAGRIMLNRINQLFNDGKSFAIETTLATKIYKSKIEQVQEGGHNIPEYVIERRYISGLKNLFNIYMPIVDELLIFDNTNLNVELIAEKRQNSELIVIELERFNTLKLSQNG